jgi:hypothetical protein
MNLPAKEVERYYSIWLPLLSFVNRRLGAVPAMLSAGPAGPWAPEDAAKVRDALWEHDALLDAFLAENPAGLSPAGLALASSWRYRVGGAFYVLRHLKKHTLFLGESPSAVYGVLGLASPLEELLPFVPVYVRTALLPYEGQIVCDGLLTRYNITFGRGIRDRFEQTYRDAKERDAILTSLGPAGPPSPEAAAASAQATNEKVLSAFRTYLYSSGRGPKVAERDLNTASGLAEALRLGQPPRSLRETTSEDVLNFAKAAASLKEGQRRERRTGLKRFVQFLRDTERMDYDGAVYALEVLKEEGRA